MEAPDLITLDEVKRSRGILNDPSANVDDELLIRFIHAASQTIWSRTGRHFVPYRGTRSYDGRGYHIVQGRTCLDLDEDLLSITTVVDGDLTRLPEDIIPENANQTPYWRLCLADPDERWGQVKDRQSIFVTGLWGFHESYSLAWATTTTLTGGIDATTTTIGVDSVADLSRLGYIRVGDEFMQIERVNESDLLIEVRRGARGTTAASALSGAALFTFIPTEDVQHACGRLVSFYYDRRDTIGERISIAGSALAVEGAIPPEITQTLSSRRRLPLMFV